MSDNQQAQALGDLPAFPYSALTPGGPQMYADSKGLTRREEFARSAMQGLVANGQLIHEAAKAASSDSSTMAAVVAVLAVQHADALLAELAKERTT